MVPQKVLDRIKYEHHVLRYHAEFLNQIGTCGEPNMKHEREHGT